MVCICTSYLTNRITGIFFVMYTYMDVHACTYICFYSQCEIDKLLISNFLWNKIKDIKESSFRSLFKNIINVLVQSQTDGNIHIHTHTHAHSENLCKQDSSQRILICNLGKTHLSHCTVFSSILCQFCLYNKPSTANIIPMCLTSPEMTSLYFSQCLLELLLNKHVANSQTISKRGLMHLSV